MPFAATWMDLEAPCLEVPQTEEDKSCMSSLICGILKIQRSGELNPKDADSQTERTNYWLRVGRRRESKRHELLCKEGSRMDCATQGLERMLCANDKWKVTF